MSLSPRYRKVAEHVDRVPRSATELYRRYAGLEEHKSLSGSHRKSRLWFAHALENLAEKNTITRSISDEDGRIYFWRQPGQTQGLCGDGDPVVNRDGGGALAGVPVGELDP